MKHFEHQNQTPTNWNGSCFIYLIFRLFATFLIILLPIFSAFLHMQLWTC